VKVATFNINNINKRLPNLLAWLKAAKPVVVCPQELRAETRAFRPYAFRNVGPQRAMHQDSYGRSQAYENNFLFETFVSTACT